MICIDLSSEPCRLTVFHTESCRTRARCSNVFIHLNNEHPRRNISKLCSLRENTSKVRYQSSRITNYLLVKFPQLATIHELRRLLAVCRYECCRVSLRWPANESVRITRRGELTEPNKVRSSLKRQRRSAAHRRSSGAELRGDTREKGLNAQRLSLHLWTRPETLINVS